MDAIEIHIRQILQQYLQAHPSATPNELAVHAKRQLGELSRKDWWLVNEIISRVVRERK